MLCTLEGLRPEYRGKKLYVWNVNRSSAILWLNLGFHQVNIAGFVVSENVYGTDSLYHRPIITVTELAGMEDVLLVASDYVTSLEEMDLPDGVECRKYSEIMGINENLRRKKVHIYGVGLGARRMETLLKENHIAVAGYCTTDEPDATMYRGKRWRKYVAENYDENDVIIVSVLREDYKNEILDTLQEFPGNVYVSDYVSKNYLSNTIIHQVIYKVIMEGKKLYVCSRNDIYLDPLKRLLEMYNIKVAGRISINGDVGNDVYSLVEKDIYKTAVIINERCKPLLGKVIKSLYILGFSADIPNIDGLQISICNNKWYTGEHGSAKDELLQSCITFENGLDKVWYIHGKKVINPFKIMIVGGSTSTAENNYPTMWMHRLYQKLKKINVPIQMYIGGGPGRHVAYEFLAFIRDGYVVKPDIVISFSGVNNTHESNKHINQFNIHNVNRPDMKFEGNTGLAIDEDAYEFWLRIERMMKIYAEYIGASFFCFMQPMNLYMPTMSLYEKLQFELEEHRIGSRLFYNRAVDDEIYVNLSRLLQHKEGMYFDMCHYTDAGEEIVAEKIFEHIMPEVRRRLGNR